MAQKGRVAPFGDPRIKGCSPLPAAFRSVPRPSSPLSAKASTKCPYALDPRPRRRTQREDPLPATPRSLDLHSALMLPAWPPSRIPTPRARHPKARQSKTGSQSHSYPQCQRAGLRDRASGIRESLTPMARPNSFRPSDRLAGGADRDRTGDPLLAKQVLSQLSYGPDSEDRGQRSEDRPGGADGAPPRLPSVLCRLSSDTGGPGKI